MENASYGLTLCAECGLVSALHATSPEPFGPVNHAPADPPRLVAVAVVAGDGRATAALRPLPPAPARGRRPRLLVDTASGPQPLEVLLPAAFTGTDLAERRAPG